MHSIHKFNGFDHLPDGKKTGMLVAGAGFITLEDVKKTVGVQKKKDQSPGNKPGRLFGMILCDLNLITPVDLYFVLDNNKKVYTMEMSLSRYEKISHDQIRLILNEQKKGVYSFFDLVLKHGIMSLSCLQQRVFELYHIPYRRVSRFSYDQAEKKALTALLDINISAQNLVIPMVRKNSSIIVGITSPESLIFVRELNIKLPHYRIIPVFIPLPHFKSLFEKLYRHFTTDFFPPQQVAVQDNGASNRKGISQESKLLFRYKTILCDPEDDQFLISELYLKYEMLRRLTGKSQRVSRLASFNAFIRERFQALTSYYCCKKLEIILTGEQYNVEIAARPVGSLHLPVDTF